MVVGRHVEPSRPTPSHSEAERLLASIERELKWLSRTKTSEFARTVQELEHLVAELRETLRGFLN